MNRVLPLPLDMVELLSAPLPRDRVGGDMGDTSHLQFQMQIVLITVKILKKLVPYTRAFMAEE